MKLRRSNARLAAVLILLIFSNNGSFAGETNWLLAPANRDLAEYFKAETDRLATNCLAEIRTLEDWNARRVLYREQLFEMLSLAPQPPHGELKAVVTGRVEQESFIVEKLHFQSMPRLYVTANLYLPKNLTNRAPTILYVCGHGAVITNGVSYGNKVAYQHHGAWFARHGYVCLIIDTLQLGEIQGLHHGTYREGMWWWNSRGYTSAGVEVWNSIRALDYLCTRPEVDTNRFGVTGRSGGGAYSWWLAALDDRVKAAAPVAGITDLQNHVVDGCVEGHCDCMYTVNTYRWDYPQVAALVAPRPLLIVNTDDDSIFPLDGVQRTFAKVRRIYELHQAKDKLGLVIGPGGHKDTQDLQVPAFRWFNKHLKGEDSLIGTAAAKFFTPHQLKVFDALPTDQINTKIQETFVLAAQTPMVPTSAEAWRRQREEWKTLLSEKTFAGWPKAAPALNLEKKAASNRKGLVVSRYEFTSQPQVQLELVVVHPAGLKKAERLMLNVTAQPLDLESAAAFDNAVTIHFAPRGLSLPAWTGDARKQIQIRRRFMLLGQTLAGMRAWDVRRAVQATRSLKDWSDAQVWIKAEGELAVCSIYAAIFEPGVAGLELGRMPASHSDGPDLLNVSRVLDVPQAMAMAADQTRIRIHDDAPERWSFVTDVGRNAHWEQGRFAIERAPATSSQ